jgi:hypothetical protein
MQPKIILGPAWAAQESMLDSALASLFDIDLSNILAATEDTRCPRCDNPPADSKARLFTDGPATATPEKVSGHVIVRCLCETVYADAYVHEVNTQQPVGEAQVRAVSAVAVPKPATPPGQHRTLDSNDVVLARHRHQGWHPAFDQPNLSAAVIWASVEARRRAVAATTAHLRQNPATD